MSDYYLNNLPKTLHYYFIQHNYFTNLCKVISINKCSLIIPLINFNH